jgi:2-(1,2-epoxy-1,2-dihydrophenyl)acetyl-CoA isomerase
MRALGDVALRLHRLPKPTIAKVDGVAAGAGMSMALGCDLIVASDSARFSQIFARRGLSVDFGASWLLPRLIGLHRAKELAFFADIIDAHQAAEFGLVNHVVPAEELDAFVDDWATRLAAGPPLALSMTKTLLNNSLNLSMDQALEEESRSQAVNFGSEDTLEALAAFTQKRDPTFKGR